MEKVGISYTDYYLPAYFMELEELFRSSSEFVLPCAYETVKSYCSDYYMQSKISGVYVEKERKELEIFDILLDKFFSEMKITPKDIDLLICTVDPNRKIFGYEPYKLPSQIHAKYKMGNATILTLGQACSATLMSAQVVRSLMVTHKYKNALILSASLINKTEDRIIPVTLLGDGAGLMFIQQNGKHEIVDCYSTTEDSYDDSEEHGSGKIDFKKKMQVLKKGVIAIETILDHNNMVIEDIDRIIPQNLNESGWDVYCGMLGINKSKVYLKNLPDGGHIGDVDIIRNYTDMQREGLIKEHSNILMYSSGWGTSWNTALIRV